MALPVEGTSTVTAAEAKGRWRHSHGWPPDLQGAALFQQKVKDAREFLVKLTVATRSLSYN